MNAIPWMAVLKQVLDLLWGAATDPPDEYDGIRTTSEGNEYEIYKIPDFVPKDFSITVWIPGEDRPSVFVRERYFEAGAPIDSLLAHEGRHVDQWVQLGQTGFLAAYAQHDKRRRMEADGYSESLAWRMQNDGYEPTTAGQTKLDYWMLHFAALIDQAYHIRGSGIKEAYEDLASFVRTRFAYDPKPWSDVAQWKNDFR